MEKERLMVGDREKLLVIGKSAKTRSFKGIHEDKLAVNYECNSKAWATAAIMTKWLKQLDEKMRRKRRKILLFLDNATSHPTNLNLNSVDLVFIFPPNCTSVAQPLVQGIIENLKVRYRSFSMKHLLATF